VFAFESMCCVVDWPCVLTDILTCTGLAQECIWASAGQGQEVCHFLPTKICCKSLHGIFLLYKLLNY